MGRGGGGWLGGGGGGEDRAHPPPGSGPTCLRWPAPAPPGPSRHPSSALSGPHLPGHPPAGHCMDPVTLAEWPSPLPPSATGRTQAQSGEGPASPSQPTGHGINPNGAPAQAALGKRRFWKGPERWHSCRWRLLRTRSHGGRADGPPVRPPSRQLDAQAGLDAQLLQGPPPGTGAQDLSCRRGPHSGRGFGSN